MPAVAMAVITAMIVMIPTAEHETKSNTRRIINGRGCVDDGRSRSVDNCRLLINHSRLLLNDDLLGRLRADHRSGRNSGGVRNARDRNSCCRHNWLAAHHCGRCCRHSLVNNRRWSASINNRRTRSNRLSDNRGCGNAGQDFARSGPAMIVMIIGHRALHVARRKKSQGCCRYNLRFHKSNLRSA